MSSAPPSRNGQLSRFHRRLAWLTLAASGAVYVGLSLWKGQPFHPWGSLDDFDLRVYRGAARLVVHGEALYGGSIWRWAPFTYPPFAALLFAPLAGLPWWVDQILAAALSVAALAVLVHCTLRLGCAVEMRPPLRRRRLAAQTPAILAGAIWLEPITATLGYGQIDLLVALLIVADLSRSDGARSKGALVGLAAGLKLTPMIFVLYLFFSRRRRAALVALGTFGFTVAAGWASVPGDSSRFWGGLFLDSGRTGGCCLPANQSIRGVLLQMYPGLPSAWLVLVAVIVGVVGVGFSVLASRRGDEAVGFSLCAVTGLLVSPVSWTHHWTLAVPAVLLLGVRAVQRRSKLGLAALFTVALAGYSYLPKLMATHRVAPGARLPLGWMLASSLYVLLGSLAVLAMCLLEARTLLTSPRKAGAPSRYGRKGPTSVLPRPPQPAARRRRWWSSGQARRVAPEGFNPTD